MAEERESYALARIDLPDARTHGWQVRLQRRGKKYAKFFADRIYGGPGEAMRASKEWRDALLRELDQADRIRICTRSERNQSGVVGVSKVRVATNGAIYEFWQATWSPEPGRRRSVKFSIRRYGDRKAFRLAVEAREEGIGKDSSE